MDANFKSVQIPRQIQSREGGDFREEAVWLSGKGDQVRPLSNCLDDLRNSHPGQAEIGTT